VAAIGAFFAPAVERCGNRPAILWIADGHCAGAGFPPSHEQLAAAKTAKALIASQFLVSDYVVSQEEPVPMRNDDDAQHQTRWRNSEVSRNFHRLGLPVAAIIFRRGLMLMAKDALGLQF
jgi:hypothetical protein